MHLPKVEDEHIWNTLKNDISAQLNAGDNYAAQLFTRFGDSQRALIIRILNTYRRAKRFASQYALNHGHTSQQIGQEIRAIDLFWIELLQIYDRATYDALANAQYDLLWSDGDMLKLKSGICTKPEKDDRHEYTGDKFWKTETPNILRELFKDERHITRYSLCLIENFPKYFSFNVSSFKLSVKELGDLFKEEANVKSTVSSWIDTNKYLNSILFQLKHLDVARLSEAHLKAYIEGLLYLTLFNESKRQSSVWKVKRMLYEERFNADIYQHAHDVMKNWFNELSNDETNLLKLARMLRAFYASVTFDDKGREEAAVPTLLKNDEIEAMLKSLMKRYLTHHEDLTALDLFNKDSGLNRMFGFCSVCTYEPNFEEGIDFGTYKQAAFDVIINHFAARPNKPTIEEYQSAMDKLYAIEDPVLIDPQDEYAYWSYMEEKRAYEFDEFWGCGANSKEQGGLKEFESRCFINPSKSEDKESSE